MPRNSSAKRLEIVRRYSDGERPSILAEKFGVSRQAINSLVRRSGIPRRTDTLTVVPCQRCGVGMAFTGVCQPNPSRPRRKFCSAHCRSATASERQRIVGPTLEGGYRNIAIPVNHVSWKSSRQSKNRVREHIAIAEQTLGRPLNRGEVVHHIDGDPLNNARTNLLICTQAYHALIHARMSYRYQREHFAVRN